MGSHHVIDRSNKTFDLKLNGTVSIDSIKPAYHLSDSLAPSQPQKQHESIMLKQLLSINPLPDLVPKFVFHNILLLTILSKHLV